MSSKAITLVRKFDLEEFAQSVHRISPSDFDMSKAGDVELTKAELTCLDYMADIESSIAIYKRNALVSHFAYDATISQFLNLWAYEEDGHAETITQYLMHYRVKRGLTQPNRLYLQTKSRKSFLSFSQRFGWLSIGLFANILPQLFMPTYLCWGTANEYLTGGGGYHRIAKNTSCPILKQIMNKIAGQEFRHAKAYSAIAFEYLQNHRIRQKIVRYILKHSWTMVGIGIRPALDGMQVANYLCQNQDELEYLKNLDNQIGKIPGLENLNLLQHLALQANTGLKTE